MKTIPLTRGLVARVDDEDYDQLVAMGKWCAAVSGRNFYAVRAARRADGGRTTVSMHSFLTGWALTDHADGDGLNNQRANLRPADKSKNACNSRRRSDNTSGYRGVTYRKDTGRWMAQIWVDGQRIGLGCFASREAAASAYDSAARLYHEEFATLNAVEVVS